jgi:hypothetical protein
MKRLLRPIGRESKQDKSHLRSGPIAEIARLFILPIMKACPHEVELNKWVEIIFGAKERTICQYEVQKKFVVPGMYYLKPGIPIPGYKGFGRRTVHYGSRIWVRWDKKFPNRVDLEAQMGSGRISHVFQLTQREWEHIKLNKFVKALNFEEPFSEVIPTQGRKAIWQTPLT